MNSLSLSQQLIPNSISKSNSSSFNTNNKKSSCDGNGLPIKPFSCHKCERTFNSKYNVIRHLKQYHADRRQFKCNICGRDYKWIDSLHKHMKIHKNSSIDNNNIISKTNHLSLNSISLDMSNCSNNNENTYIEEIDEMDQNNNDENINNSEFFEDLDENNDAVLNSDLI